MKTMFKAAAPHELGQRDRRSPCGAASGTWLFRIAVLSVLALPAGCGGWLGLVMPNEATDPVDTDGFELLTRFAHFSDAHIVDEESPGRLTAVAGLSTSAWRPHEAYSTQVLDGFIRTVNKLHVARHPIDFVVHTGDATDNAQLNELEWFVTLLDGGLIDPLTGPDNREPASRLEPLLDPHQPFDAQGLYRRGVHGDASTIPWYSLLGNHDRFAVGVFPIVTNFLGHRTSPLPLQDRPGLFLPVVLNPVGFLSWAPITPAHPGPPPDVNLPALVEANPLRRYFTDREFVETHLESAGEPPGHGFDADHPGRTWYSVSPAPGLRLIALNSATPMIEQPTLAYPEGSISPAQAFFLRNELNRAQEKGECVIVATHHLSDTLEAVYGTALSPQSFRRMLNEYTCVKLHLAGHWHENVVLDRGGYVEIATGSTLDAPQQGRIIEIWRRTTPLSDGPRAELVPTKSGARADDRMQQLDPTSVEFRYWMFSHLDEIEPTDDSHVDLFDDPLLPMRRIAAELAGAVAGQTHP